MNKFKKTLFLILYAITFICIISYILLSRNALPSDSSIKTHLEKRLKAETSIIKKESNEKYNIIFFETDNKPGLAVYKLNSLYNTPGREYLFCYPFPNANPLYNYTFINYGIKEREIIIYGKNIDNKLDVVIVSHNNNKVTENLNDKNNFFLNYIVKNEDTFGFDMVFKDGNTIHYSVNEN